MLLPYRYPGLPPGPIASPGKASLEAVVRPADVDYVYFVSRNDGSHQFSRNLAEHERAVDLYQRHRRAQLIGPSPPPNPSPSPGPSRTATPPAASPTRPPGPRS